MPLPFFGAIWLEVRIWDLISASKPIPMAVLILLLAFSLFSWTLIFAKWNVFRRARTGNVQFLRVFRKAGAPAQLQAAVEQFKGAPVATVFEFGYEEVERQVQKHGTVRNPIALERCLQLGVNEELAYLERHMNWLATTASVCPFIGLFGTVWGIIDAFTALSLAGSASLRAVGPGMADALVATAMGLAAAIPAAVFYNYFGHVIKEIGARMEDFALEFMNVTERTYLG
jgi:biopolymer transport protein TolQ